jgi:hypothetical protein
MERSCSIWIPPSLARHGRTTRSSAQGIRSGVSTLSALVAETWRSGLVAQLDRRRGRSAASARSSGAMCSPTHESSSASSTAFAHPSAIRASAPRTGRSTISLCGAPDESTPSSLRAKRLASRTFTVVSPSAIDTCKTVRLRWDSTFAVFPSLKHFRSNRGAIDRTWPLAEAVAISRVGTVTEIRGRYACCRPGEAGSKSWCVCNAHRS